MNLVTALTNKELKEYYLSWVNDYLTLSVFAEHNEWSIDRAKWVIEQGKALHEFDFLDLD